MPTRQIVKGPYLQFAPTGEMLVLWETDRPAPSRVDYGRETADGDFVDQSAPVRLHRIALRGLEADTAYRYRVHSGQAQAGPFSFRTPPAEPIPFTFAVFGDSRTSAEQSAGVGRLMAGHDPHFLLHSGDLVSNGTIYEQWEEQFFTPLGDVIARTPLFPVPGNHEQNAAHFYNYFPSGSWYSFVYGDAHFIALDTNEATGGFTPGSEQYGWLERTLAQSEARWRVLWFHHPPYSSGSHGCSVGQREALAPLLERYQVDVVFNGHDHIYERSFPMRGNRRADDGVVYVVTGGGGAPLYPVDAGEWTACATSVHHCCIVSINGPHLRWQVYDLDGVLIDYCWLCKDPAFVVAQIENLGSSPRRSEALHALGALCCRDAVPALLALLADADGSTRRLLAEALARMGEPWAREALEEMSASTELETVRWASLGLALVARKAPSHRLLNLLKHGDNRVRQAATQGLKFVQTDWATQALAGAVADEDVVVRRNAARALAPKAQQVASSVWRAVLQDEDVLVRLAGLQAIQGEEGLGELSDVLHQLLEHDHVPTRRGAIQALARQPQMDNLEFFLMVLHDEDEQVRHHATEALQELTGEVLHHRPEAWRWWFEQRRDGQDG